MSFVDRIDHGVPNLAQLAPRLWRCGHPADDAAWDYLHQAVGPDGSPVLLIGLHDLAECGSDAYASTFRGWIVNWCPMPPREDEPWTVLALPSPRVVRGIVDLIAQAYDAGETVIWHCKHGRDRTGLISALVGMRLLGWTKEFALQNMLSHGFRWELPGLDLYWALDVPAGDAS